MTKNNIVTKTNTLIRNDAPLKIIYELDYGTQVGMVMLRDGNCRCSVGIVVISEDGQVSDMVSIKKSKIMTGKNTFNFLYDFGDFAREDIIAVHNRVLEEIKKNKAVVYAKNYVSWEHMYKLIAAYVNENEVPDLIEKDKDYMYIETGAFEQMIDEICNNHYIECKKRDLLSIFLACRVLEPNKNVPYLYKKKKSGENEYIYVYRLRILNNTLTVQEEKE